MSEPIDTTLKELFDGWPDNESKMTQGFSGRKAKNVCARSRRGELPIATLREENDPGGEVRERIYFPSKTAEFLIAEKNDQGELQTYSPKISLFGREKRSDPDDASFMISAAPNLKATFHKTLAHVKLYTGQDFQLEKRLIHTYEIENKKVIAVASDFRRYALVATLAMESWSYGFKQQVLDQIRRRGMETYKTALEGTNKPIETIFNFSDSGDKAPLKMLVVNNFRELLQEAFS